MLFGTAVISPATSTTPKFQTVEYSRLSPIVNLIVNQVEAQSIPEATSTPLTEKEVKTLVDKYAKKYGANAKSMMETIRCEDPTFDPKAPSGIFNDEGEQEDSHGLAQIHLPAHPDITLEQAQDPDFSVDFMARQFASGNAHLWTCWRLLKKSGKI